MILFFQIILLISVLAILHSYVLFPLYLEFRTTKKSLPDYGKDDVFPNVHVLLSAYNEEAVIAQKLQSLLDSDYPSSKLQIIVGSDCSTDQTEEIVKGFQKKTLISS